MACLSDTDCDQPTAARCDAGACVGCDMSEQCAGIGMTNVCDTATTTCVECLATTDCASMQSCNLLTNQCTPTPEPALRTCDACTNDDQCPADHRCIRMQYMGVDRDPGWYCMREFNMVGDCERPFLSALMDRMSINGAAEQTYCGIDESTVSCEAVRALQDSVACPGGVADCMADGARCETVGLAPNQCTYSCGVHNNCPLTINCNTYCGG